MAGEYYISGTSISPSTPKYTRDGLKALPRNKLDDILKSLGVTKIPKNDNEKINKILELTR